MRALVGGLLCLALLGCGTPGFGGLGQGASGTQLTAKDGNVLDTTTTLDAIISSLSGFSEDGYMLIPAEVTIDDNLKKKIDDNQDGKISLIEIAYAVRMGIALVTINDAKHHVTITPGTGPVNNGTFTTVTDQEKYYAGNPDDGLLWYGNAARVKLLDDTLVTISLSEFAQNGMVQDIDTMRTYYNNTDHPPFDGSDPAYHQSQLREIEDQTIAIARELGNPASPDSDSGDALAGLQDLRKFLQGANVNDGRTLTDHYAELDKLNQTIDGILGVPDAAPTPRPAPPASSSAPVTH